jgi:hypothetical protein
MQQTQMMPTSLDVDAQNMIAKMELWARGIPT